MNGGTLRPPHDCENTGLWSKTQTPSRQSEMALLQNPRRPGRVVGKNPLTPALVVRDKDDSLHSFKFRYGSSLTTVILERSEESPHSLCCRTLASFLSTKRPDQKRRQHPHSISSR